MARAAYEDAVAQMSGPYGGEADHARGGNVAGTIERADSGKTRECDAMLFNARKDNVVNIQHDEKAMNSRIEDIWRSSGGTVDTKMSQTMDTLLPEIDSLVAAGLGAFSSLDTTNRQLNQSKELAENRAREAKRLHSIDEQSRATLSVSAARATPASFHSHSRIVLLPNTAN